jgi:hypothetical protein
MRPPEPAVVRQAGACLMLVQGSNQRARGALAVGRNVRVPPGRIEHWAYGQDGFPGRGLALASMLRVRSSYKFE